MKTIQLPYNFTPRDDQVDFMNEMDRKRFGVIRAHRRWGKDKMAFNYLVKKAFERVGLYLYIFENGTEAERAVWNNTDNDGFALLQHFSPEVLEQSNINNNKMMIKLPNGSIFRCVGGADPDTLRGANAMGVVFSEFAFCNPDAWTSAISPMIMGNNGWVIFNSTPRLPGDHFEKICQTAKNNPERWAYCEWQTYDSEWDNYTGYQTPKDLDFMRLTAPEDQIVREYGCRIEGAVEGSYYTKDIQLAREQGRIGNFDVDDKLYVDVFFDLGLSDDTSMWFRQVSGNRMVMVDYHEASQRSLAQHVDTLVEKGYRYRDLVLPWDGSHKTLQTNLRTSDVFQSLVNEAGLRARVHVCCKAPVQDGINAVRSRFRRYYFDKEKCNVGLMHLESYHRKYNQATRSFTKDPAHDVHSHAADALRSEAVWEDIDSYGGGGQMGGYQDSIKLDVEYDPFG